eukprot:TRINITY_DN23371_c0_g2_i1.p1 TRINITY_DN23371_c0_g2~~TRINITY_DN23371_c0_g2_i1.p1  ORF type:complete len:390 (+),score=154.16 TRINITY_DN23371_c0_g2_i1:75-1244(+)
MAPKKGTKRAATEASEPTAQQKLNAILKERGVTKGNYNGILEAINHRLAEGLTDEVRKMLIAMLPDGLFQPVSKRHALQEATVKMLDEVYQNIQNKMQAEIDAEVSALSSVEASKAGLESKVQDAEAALKIASDDLDARKITLAEKAKLFRDAKAVLEEKQKEQEDGDAASIVAKADLNALQTAFKEDFIKLRDGDAEASEKHYERLAPVAAKAVDEASLLTALPSCMTKKPTERGSFDTMVVAQLQEALEKKIAELTATIENAAPASAAFQAAVTSAEEALEAAKQEQHVVAEAVEAAVAFKKQRSEEDSAAKASLESYEPEYKEACQARDAKIAQLDNFKEWNVACYEVVRNREEIHPAKKAKTGDVAQVGQELCEAAAKEAVAAGA